MSTERRSPRPAGSAETRADSGSGRSSRPDLPGRQVNRDASGARIERGRRGPAAEQPKDDGGLALDARVAPQAAESGPAHQG